MQNIKIKILIPKILPVKINGPKNIKKFPKYKGCLNKEYIPVVFRVSANCCFVLRPEVPAGVYATVKIRMASPRNDIIIPEYNRIHSNSPDIEFDSK